MMLHLHAKVPACRWPHDKRVGRSPHVHQSSCMPSLLRLGLGAPSAPSLSAPSLSAGALALQTPGTPAEAARTKPRRPGSRWGSSRQTWPNMRKQPATISSLRCSKLLQAPATEQRLREPRGSGVAKSLGCLRAQMRTPARRSECPPCHKDSTMHANWLIEKPLQGECKSAKNCSKALPAFHTVQRRGRGRGGGGKGGRREGLSKLSIWQRDVFWMNIPEFSLSAVYLLGNSE